MDRGLRACRALGGPVRVPPTCGRSPLRGPSKEPTPAGIAARRGLERARSLLLRCRLLARVLVRYEGCHGRNHRDVARGRAA
jgi:hypothetical protein